MIRNKYLKGVKIESSKSLVVKIQKDYQIDGVPIVIFDSQDQYFSALLGFNKKTNREQFFELEVDSRI